MVFFWLFDPLYNVPATVHFFYMDNKKMFKSLSTFTLDFFGIFHCLLL